MCFLAEIILGPFYCKYYGVKEARRYRSLPLVSPRSNVIFRCCWLKATTFAEVAKTIRALNIPEIDSIEAGDLFRGKNVPVGKYSHDGTSNFPELRSYSD